MKDKMHIHKALQAFVEIKHTPFILQIGGMDGKTADPIFPFLSRYDWPAVIVEPITEYFQKLSQTYARRPLVKCRELAIDNHDGQAVMHMVGLDYIETASAPNWAAAASSLYMDRTALGWASIKPMTEERKVACLTLESLIKQEGIDKIDVLQIDAEGHDFHILKQLDFKRFQPKVINLEFVNLPENEQKQCFNLLHDQFYQTEKTGYDLIAIHASFQDIPPP